MAGIETIIPVVDLGWGFFLIEVVSLMLGIGLLIFGLNKLYHWIKDYPIEVVLRTQRSSGETYVTKDRVGRFFNKENGKEYCRLKKAKINFANIPFSEIENMENKFGFSELFRSAHDEISPCIFNAGGEIKPSLESDVKFWCIEGLISDFKRYNTDGLWAKWGQIIFLAAIGIILFLLIIGLTTLAQQYAAISQSITGATQNYAIAEESKLKNTEINLLIYAIENKILINNTEIFKELNLTEDQLIYNYNRTINL